MQETEVLEMWEAALPIRQGLGWMRGANMGPKRGKGIGNWSSSGIMVEM